jgi:hypothetical protein
MVLFLFMKQDFIIKYRYQKWLSQPLFKAFSKKRQHRPSFYARKRFKRAYFAF